MTAITAKQSDPKTAYQDHRDFFNTAESRHDDRPPSRGVPARWRTLDHRPDDVINFWKPVCELVPIQFQQREPGKGTSAESPGEKFGYGGVRNQPIRLRERWEDAGCFAATPTPESPDENADHAVFWTGDVP